jgi:hypothetical protein
MNRNLILTLSNCFIIFFSISSSSQSIQNNYLEANDYSSLEILLDAKKISDTLMFVYYTTENNSDFLMPVIAKIENKKITKINANELKIEMPNYNCKIHFSGNFIWIVGLRIPQRENENLKTQVVLLDSSLKLINQTSFSDILVESEIQSVLDSQNNLYINTVDNQVYKFDKNLDLIKKESVDGVLIGIRDTNLLFSHTLISSNSSINFTFFKTNLDLKNRIDFYKFMTNQAIQLKHLIKDSLFYIIKEDHTQHQKIEICQYDNYFKLKQVDTINLFRAITKPMKINSINAEENILYLCGSDFSKPILVSYDLIKKNTKVDSFILFDINHEFLDIKIVSDSIILIGETKEFGYLINSFVLTLEKSTKKAIGSFQLAEFDFEFIPSIFFDIKYNQSFGIIGTKNKLSTNIVKPNELFDSNISVFNYNQENAEEFIEIKGEFSGKKEVLYSLDTKNENFSFLERHNLSYNSIVSYDIYNYYISTYSKDIKLLNSMEIETNTKELLISNLKICQTELGEIYYIVTKYNKNNTKVSHELIKLNNSYNVEWRENLTPTLNGQVIELITIDNNLFIIFQNEEGVIIRKYRQRSFLEENKIIGIRYGNIEIKDFKMIFPMEKKVVIYDFVISKSEEIFIENPVDFNYLLNENFILMVGNSEYKIYDIETKSLTSFKVNFNFQSYERILFFQIKDKMISIYTNFRSLRLESNKILIGDLNPFFSMEKALSIESDRAVAHDRNNIYLIDLKSEKIVFKSTIEFEFLNSEIIGLSLNNMVKKDNKYILSGQIINTYEYFKFNAGRNRFSNSKGYIGLIDLEEVTSTTSIMNNQPNMLLYPNPIEDELNILLKDNFEVVAVNIFNMKGQKLYEKTLNTNSKEIKINFDEISGLYLLTVVTTSRTFHNFFYKR